MQQQLEGKTLAQLLGMCQEYPSCFQGYSTHKRKSDLLEFMESRIELLIEVAEFVPTLPVVPPIKTNTF